MTLFVRLWRAIALALSASCRDRLSPNGAGADRVAPARLCRGRLRRRGVGREGGQPVRICRNARILGLGSRTHRRLAGQARERPAPGRRRPAARRDRAQGPAAGSRADRPHARHRTCCALIRWRWDRPASPTRPAAPSSTARIAPAAMASTATPKRRWRRNSTRRRSPSPTAPAPPTARRSLSTRSSTRGSKARRWSASRTCRRGQMGARLPCRPLRLPGFAGRQGQGDLGQRSVAQGPGPRPRRLERHLRTGAWRKRSDPIGRAP